MARAGQLRTSVLVGASVVTAMGLNFGVMKLGQTSTTSAGGTETVADAAPAAADVTASTDAVVALTSPAPEGTIPDGGVDPAAQAGTVPDPGGAPVPKPPVASGATAATPPATGGPTTATTTRLTLPPASDPTTATTRPATTATTRSQTTTTNTTIQATSTSRRGSSTSTDD